MGLMKSEKTFHRPGQPLIAVSLACFLPAMAGVAQQFVEAIEWTIAHNIVQFAQPRPWFIIIYVYRRDRDEDATPFAMISKNEHGQPENFLKVRVWEDDMWDYMEPLFARSCRAAEYLARHYSPSPCRHLGIGVSRVFTSFPIAFPVPKNQLRHSSYACEWLRESNLFYDFAIQYHNNHEARRDVHGQGDFVEEKENWDQLFEDTLDMLIRLME
jgi:hypothetical protein